MSKLEELLRHPALIHLGHDHPDNGNGSTDEEYWWCEFYHQGSPIEIDDNNLDDLVTRTLDFISGKRTG